jgi:hypothetical protein
MAKWLITSSLAATAVLADPSVATVVTAATVPTGRRASSPATVETAAACLVLAMEVTDAGNWPATDLFEHFGVTDL